MNPESNIPESEDLEAFRSFISRYSDPKSQKLINEIYGRFPVEIDSIVNEVVHMQTIGNVQESIERVRETLMKIAPNKGRFGVPLFMRSDARQIQRSAQHES